MLLRGIRRQGNKQTYTDEQLRYMIAPPITTVIDESRVTGPKANASGIKGSLLKSDDPSRKTSEPGDVVIPVWGSIGNSARSRAQMKAAREKPKER